MSGRGEVGTAWSGRAWRAWRAASLGVALALGAPVSGQITAPPASPLDLEPGSELTVYLMTMGEGDLVWERFGHNALWIHDPVTGTDHAYNWGLFDFDEPGFLRRFIQGRMWYWMDAFDAHLTAQAYTRANRSVWIQELNLTPRQRHDLAEFLAWHRRPENRFYRYDYYYDNCSTRVRDAIDRALGGQIRDQTVDAPSGETFRSHTRRASANDVLTYTGLAAGLGPDVDREISIWEEMFLPLAMRERVRALTVVGADGREAPLVLSEGTMFVADRPPMLETPPRWWPWYLAVGLLLAALVLGLGHVAAGGPSAPEGGAGRAARATGSTGAARAARATLAGVGVAWALVAGLLGVVLAGLWAFTDHSAAYHNENLFLFNPLALGLVVLVPMLLYRPGRADRWAVGVAALVAGLALLGVLLKPLPWLGQVNGELIALALPVHLAVAVVAFLLATRTNRAPGGG
jgi:hypothetical protein